MSEKDGGPAFPVVGSETPFPGGGTYVQLPNPGMSKREYFAAAALIGICAGLTSIPKNDEDSPRASARMLFRGAAADARMLADAMIAELNGMPGPAERQKGGEG